MYTSVCNIHVLGAKIINSRKAPRDRRREVDGERESERETEKRNGEREITDGDRNEQSRIIARNGIVIFKESHKDTRHGERERERPFVFNINFGRLQGRACSRLNGREMQKTRSFSPFTFLFFFLFTKKATFPVRYSIYSRKLLRDTVTLD